MSTPSAATVSGTTVQPSFYYPSSGSSGSGGNTANLAKVATTGQYGDLLAAPVLATVATSGKYLDLVGLPNLQPVAISGQYNDLGGLPALKTVATSGKFSDLAITAPFTISNQDANGRAANFITPGATSNFVLIGSALSNGASAAVGWSGPNVMGLGLFGGIGMTIDNTGKVAVSSLAVNGAALAAVATSGAYSSLTGLPTLSTVATSGSYADLLNKPALATVATSGSYADLSNKPNLSNISGPATLTGTNSATSVLTLLNPGASAGNTTAIQFATYPTYTSNPPASIVTIDDGNFSNSVQIRSKIQGASGNADQPTATFASTRQVTFYNDVTTPGVSAANAALATSTGGTGGFVTDASGNLRIGATTGLTSPQNFTTYTLNGWTVSASSEYVGAPANGQAWKACDGDNSSGWANSSPTPYSGTNGAYTGNKTTLVGGNSVPGEWWQIQAPTPVAPTSIYRLTGYTGVPAFWAASNDGVSFTQITGSVTSASSLPIPAIVYPVTNSGPWTYFRMIVTAGSSNGASNFADLLTGYLILPAVTSGIASLPNQVTLAPSGLLSTNFGLTNPATIYQAWFLSTTYNLAANALTKIPKANFTALAASGISNGFTQNTDGSVTIVVRGVYSCGVTLRFGTAAGTGQEVSAGILMGGSDARNAQQATPALGATASATWALQPGDTVSPVAYSTAANTVIPGVSQQHFFVALVTRF